MDVSLKEVRNKGKADGKLRIVVDGYNAPLTAGNFVDLVDKKFYDGMDIQRADGFVVQTGDPGTDVSHASDGSVEWHVEQSIAWGMRQEVAEWAVMIVRSKQRPRRASTGLDVGSATDAAVATSLSTRNAVKLH